MDFWENVFNYVSTQCDTREYLLGSRGILSIFLLAGKVLYLNTQKSGWVIVNFHGKLDNSIGVYLRKIKLSARRRNDTLKLLSD